MARSKTKRAQIPSYFAYFQLIFRGFSLMNDVLNLILAIYVSAKYKYSNPVAYVGIILALGIDLSEALGLATKDKIPRLRARNLIISELIIIIVIMISFWFVYMSRPADKRDMWNNNTDFSDSPLFVSMGVL
jgi:NO-binding membrane sensor protein with MHYT domain